MNKKWKFEIINPVVQQSKSMKEFLQLLQIFPNGNSYNQFKRIIKRLNINNSHWIKEVVLPKPKCDINKYLVKDCDVPLRSIKNRLIKEGLLENKCSACGINQWTTPISSDNSIQLQIDHINGINNDHRIENIRLLCPNCHSKTHTFAGKNSKRIKKIKVCLDCSKIVYKDSIRCRPCSSKIAVRKKKINWPSPEEMAKLVWEKSSVKLAHELGVSDKAIEKYCKKHNISKPPRGYWMKSLS